MSSSSSLKQKFMVLCLGLSGIVALQSLWGSGRGGVARVPDPVIRPSGEGTRIEMQGKWLSDRRPINLDDPKTLGPRGLGPGGGPTTAGASQPAGLWWLRGGVPWAIAFFPHLGQPLQDAGRTEVRSGSGGRLRVDLSDRRVYVYPNSATNTQPITSYPVAVAKPGWETPTGNYRIERMEKDPIWQHPLTGRIVEPGPDNPLGAAWIGFWSDTGVHFGFHGTQDESLIGQAVSHGCLRMRNADILALYRYVKPDTLVQVQP